MKILMTVVAAVNLVVAANLINQIAPGDLDQDAWTKIAVSTFAIVVALWLLRLLNEP